MSSRASAAGRSRSRAKARWRPGTWSADAAPTTKLPRMAPSPASRWPPTLPPATADETSRIPSSSANLHRSSGDACPRVQLPDELDFHAQGLIDRPGTRVTGKERPSVLPRGRPDERVVDSSTRDPQPDELGAEVAGLHLAEKRRHWEVAGQQADDV